VTGPPPATVVVRSDVAVLLLPARDEQAAITAVWAECGPWVEHYRRQDTVDLLLPVV
jgi:hypothetical protein